MNNKEIEQLKKDGWTEYTPTMNFVVTDENDRTIQTPAFKHFYKQEGKIVSVKIVQTEEIEPRISSKLPT